MVYALWDNETNNLVAAFPTEGEAVAVALSGIAVNGPHDTDALSLKVEDDDGTVTLIAAGEELAMRARRSLPSDSSSLALAR